MGDIFSHPADFTPVCTTEFMTFASMEDEFKKLNTALLGLSIDSTYSHIAWLRTITEKIKYKAMEGVEVNFPVVSDYWVKTSLFLLLVPVEAPKKELTSLAMITSVLTGSFA